MTQLFVIRSTQRNFTQPMSLKAKFLNVWFFANLILHVTAHPALKALREYRLNVCLLSFSSPCWTERSFSHQQVLKLTPTNKAMDSSPFSKFHPSWTNQKAIISPNVDFRQQT